MKKIVFYLLIFFASISSAQNPDKPKNIIIMIGDGMGISQVSASVLTNPNSAFKKFPVTGFSVTCSADKLITDSAAGGTAIACGMRTKNGQIGVDAEGNSLLSIFDFAGQKKLSTGVVVTSDITNATPAAFLGHVLDRHNSEKLAEEYLSANTDILIGGGKEFFTAENSGGKRKDNQDLLKKIENNGYELYFDYASLEKSHAKKYFALLDNGELPSAEKRNYSLSDLTRKALETLSSNKNGFVLMVEGSQIDNGGHGNNQEELLSELNDFEHAIQTALNFAGEDKQTLVLVTADHETGGTAIIGGDVTGGNIKLGFASKAHTAAMVGVFAFGPGCELFSGINENYRIGKKLISLLKDSSPASSKK